jgi:5-dehydro-2-deoxygluconokinase
LAGVSTPLDLVAIGRVSVDLYGQQIGSRLEDAATFAKGVGGCPANVAIGAARLGLRAALVSRVGDEPMGRFVREQLVREGIDVRGVRTDAERLTSLVLLSVRDEQTFPLIFYRENCADSALCEDDIDASLIAAARATLVTGTHLSIPGAARAQRKAIGIAKTHGRKVVLDVDYRPTLWGIGGHGAGESRYARSARVTEAFAPVLPDCDLIVGTEEELQIAGGVEDTLAAMRRIRAACAAVIVCKRGPRGCVVVCGPVPDRLEGALVAPGMDIEVYNVLGAGDAFLAGFLLGYLRDEPHEVSARFANACGALAVSRLLCSCEFATLAELNHYLAHGSPQRALRLDPQLSHLHRVTTRRRGPATVLALTGSGAPAVEAVARVAAGAAGFGVMLEGAASTTVLREAAGSNLWVARAVEQPGSTPLEFEGADSLAARLLEWPTDITVACRCEYHPDDPRELRAAQERNLLRLAAACRAQGRELLLGIVAGRRAELREDTVARVMSRLYALEIRPDWWELEPQPGPRGWANCAAVINAQDGYCRGIVVGLEVPVAQAMPVLAAAGASRIVRGFIAGRSIFTDSTPARMSARLSDAAARDSIAERFRALVAAWQAARAPGREAAERSGQ